MSNDTMIDRYITLALEGNGFLEPEFEYSVAYVQGDHCTLKRACVALDNDQLLNSIWPTTRKIRDSLGSAGNRRAKEICRVLVLEYGLSASLVPVLQQSIEVDLDLMHIVTNLLDRESEDAHALAKLAGVDVSDLLRWAEELSDKLEHGIKKHAKDVESKIYSVLHSACLNINKEDEIIREHSIGDYSVVIETVYDENAIDDIYDGEMEDDFVLATMMSLARDQIQCVSLSCTITYLPSGIESMQSFWAVMVPYGDKTFGGFLWDAFMEAKLEMRSMMELEGSSSEEGSEAA